jgi:predicted ATP-dependent Lon-type protease
MIIELKEIFRGKVVNKAHTINTGVDEFPRYVVEYLIDNYCEEETFHKDLDVDREMVIGAVRLVHKSGGKSGTFERAGEKDWEVI